MLYLSAAKDAAASGSTFGSFASSLRASGGGEAGGIPVGQVTLSAYFTGGDGDGDGDGGDSAAGGGGLGQLGEAAEEGDLDPADLPEGCPTIEVICPWVPPCVFFLL